MIELDLVDFCKKIATQIVKANKTFGTFTKLIQQRMEKDISLMKYILTDACCHLKPHYENSELSFEEREDRKSVHFGNKTIFCQSSMK